MAIRGSRSTFPTTIDDFGSEHVNNVGEKFTASRWNTILDAVYNLEKTTTRIIKVGSDLYPSATNENRPKLLVKTYTVALTGSDAERKTASLSGFTEVEKSMFNGTPFEEDNFCYVSIRRVANTKPLEDLYIAAIKGLPSDKSGDSGWNIIVSNLADRGDAYKVPAGNYIVTLKIFSS